MKLPKLPTTDEFHLSMKIILFDKDFSSYRNTPSIENLAESFIQYEKKLVGIDYALWSKHIFNLKNKPKRYFISLVLFSLCHDEDAMQEGEFYPSSRGNRVFKSDLGTWLQTGVFGGKDRLSRESRWTLEMHKNIKRIPKHFFKQNKPKASMPVLIKYGTSSYYERSLDRGAVEKINPPIYEDGKYHRILASIPVRMNEEWDSENILKEIINQINERLHTPLVSFSELYEIWYDINLVLLSLKMKDEPSSRELVEYINKKIKTYKKYKSEKTLVYEFYAKHYEDFLDELVELKKLKKCMNCNSAYEITSRRKYCDNPRCPKLLSDRKRYLKK